MFDYVRISCAVPAITVADVTGNTDKIIAKMQEAKDQGSNLVLFPELCITGATCQDLFFQKALQEEVSLAISRLKKETGRLSMTAVVGAPLSIQGKLYDCALVISQGSILGAVPKSFIPVDHKRWFRSGSSLFAGTAIMKDCENNSDESIPVEANLLFCAADLTFGIELCEDLFAPVSPGSLLAMCGAELILNPAACAQTIDSRSYRHDLVKQQSAKCLCAYAFCSAGDTESTSDCVYSGHSLIAENGTVWAENQKHIDTDYILTADLDIGKLRADRAKNQIFSDYEPYCAANEIPMPASFASDGTLYPLNKLPFVPETREERLSRCMDIFNMQVSALKRRMTVTGSKCIVGVSGGLDSTLALLVSAKATQELGRPLSEVYGITMPGFGTTDRTYYNSLDLMKSLGVTTKIISIKDACLQHFKDIGHDPAVTDLTYENSQARERTQVLMDYAGKVGGFVVGTGDLSELALGWCTYNGDHMSMYGVNSSIPKTLLRWMIDAISASEVFPGSGEVLADILDTPISPELLPPDAEGKIAQQTECIVGPYALHDFFLFYVLRYGFEPEKIYTLAKRAFRDDFDEETILKWLKTFYRRFMTQQFKRACQPDGIRIGSVGLGSKGDWRMPSDASSRLWLAQAEALG